MNRSVSASTGTWLCWPILILGLGGCIHRSGGLHSEPTAALPCPPWVEFPASTLSNEDSIYLGCVNALNVDSMVENPADLARGRSLGPASGVRESLGITLYDQGKTKTAAAAGNASPTIVMPAASGAGTQ